MSKPKKKPELPEFEDGETDTDKLRARIRSMLGELQAAQAVNEEQASKADAFDVLLEGLAGIGFDTTNVTYHDQAQLILKMTVEGVDALLVEKMKLFDATIAKCHEKFKKSRDVVDAIVENASEAVERVRAVSEDCEDAKSFIEEVAGDQITDFMQVHNRMFHDGPAVRKKRKTEDWDVWDREDFNGNQFMHDPKTGAFYMYSPEQEKDDT